MKKFFRVNNSNYKNLKESFEIKELRVKCLTLESYENTKEISDYMSKT
jgi:hypothetical protein